MRDIHFGAGDGTHPPPPPGGWGRQPNTVVGQTIGDTLQPQLDVHDEALNELRKEFQKQQQTIADVEHALENQKQIIERHEARIAALERRNQNLEATLHEKAAAYDPRPLRRIPNLRKPSSSALAEESDTEE